MSLETSDIQGLMLGGYGKLPYARFLLLELGPAEGARAWLAEIVDEVGTAADDPAALTPRMQIAFTFPGLERLGLSWQALKGFSREFREGMAGSERRARRLGDVGPNAPQKWTWGGPSTGCPSALLMLYAPTQDALEAITAVQRERLAAHGIACSRVLETTSLPNHKEHFGFRDGISQPKIEGTRSRAAAHEVVKAGEFILGYENERRQIAASPLVDPIEDPEELLPRIGPGDLADFGRNGTYLVFRQLEQDVVRFWSWARSAAGAAGAAAAVGDGDPADTAAADRSVRIASKAVGRWPEGAPLTLHRDDPRTDSRENDFTYHEEDLHGLGCPIGSHIRRTNPRDSRPPRPGTEQSLKINRRHRLLRRGRSYGAPLTPTLDARTLLEATDDGRERGLHFVCLNADISRQFEFVQHTWINNPNFDGLAGETDPLVGVRGPDCDAFTIPEEPVRKRYQSLPDFVHVVGGAYFFLPGMRALRYLARTPRNLASAYSAPDQPATLPVDSWYARAGRASNILIEQGLSVLRRFTTLRNLFDDLLQRPLTAAVQWPIRRRRARLRMDADLAIAEERKLPGEEEVARRITEQMTAFLFRHYRNGGAERAGNTKTYGMLEAAFEVHELAPELRIGLFAEPRTYRAWVRLAGPGPRVTPDIKDHGVLSIGVKLLGVEGPKLLDDEDDTLDFSAISAPTFTTPNVFENLKLQRYLGAGMPAWYFLNPFDSHYLDMLLQGLHSKAHGSPFETSYHSCVPYLYGPGRAYKYRFEPARRTRTRVPLPAPDDYLRQAMVRTFEREAEISFTFKVQFQLDPVLMPIEDASVIWRSPEVAVATLRIPRQQFDTPERESMAREMTINPWHTIAEHRPLGNQNRARRLVYYETARVRQRINDERHRVPR